MVNRTAGQALMQRMQSGPEFRVDLRSPPDSSITCCCCCTIPTVNKFLTDTCEGKQACVGLCCEVCCYPQQAMLATHEMVWDESKSRTDPCERRLVRLSNFGEIWCCCYHGINCTVEGLKCCLDCCEDQCGDQLQCCLDCATTAADVISERQARQAAHVTAAVTEPIAMPGRPVHLHTCAA